LLHENRHLVLVANMLFGAGIGPRLYDLAEIHTRNSSWVAFVMQHAGGPPPNHEQWFEGMRRIRALRHARVVAPGGLTHPDFASPDCSGNARCDEAGNFRYFDFQNFVLQDYDRYLIDVARAAAQATHYGDRSLLRGGAYLYQSIPGVPLPAKRSIDDRVRVIETLLEKAGVSVENRLVLDVGCNIGMMMAQYLAMGAHWCVGWDLESFIEHSERVLLSIGGTRFTLRGGLITSDRRIGQEIPDFLASRLNGCVISYLAIRKHVGWLRALGEIPWAFMIYEGHEGESREDTDRHLADLQATAGCSVAATATYDDGDSRERVVAVLLR
jgi:hypothetical protein